jgi:MYXO-CTERM domain-containing protein
MNKTFALATGAALLFAAGASAAEFTMEFKSGDDFQFDGDVYENSGLITGQLYVSGLNDGDSVLAVAGTPDDALTISTGNGFFNAAEFGQNFGAPNPALYAVDSNLQWDTWLTIGGDKAGNPETSVSPGFPTIATFGGGDDIVGETNGAWFNGNPGNPQVEEDGRLLVGQFTFDITKKVTVEALVQILDANGEERREALSGSFAIPAPGAAALLGLAGLAGTRRRRG